MGPTLASKIPDQAMNCNIHPCSKVIEILFAIPKDGF